MARARLDDLIKAGLTAIAFYAAARLSAAFLVPEAAPVSPVWPPRGLALGLVLLLGDRVWPGIAVGAALDSAANGVPLVTLAGGVAGNTLSVLLASRLLRRLGFRNTLARVRDVLLLLGPAAIGTNAVGATIGVGGMGLGGVVSAGELVRSFLTWWSSDALGDLLVAPALLTWGTRAAVRAAPPRAVEAVLLGVLALLVSRVALGGWQPVGVGEQSLAYLTLPLVVWAALRFGQRGAATLVLGILGVAVWSTAQGTGPFASGSAADSLLLLQAYVGVVAVTGLVLAAVLEERRAAEGELAQQREFLRQVVDVNPSMVFAKDREGRFILINQAVADAYGSTIEGVLGKTDSDFAARDEAEAFRRDDLEVMDTGREKLVPLEPLTDAQGRLHWLQTIKRPLNFRDGSYQNLLGVATDITQRVLAEEALRASEERYRALYEDTPSMYFTVDPAGTVLSVNRFGAAQLGYQPAELVGQSVLRVFYQPDRAAAASHVEQCVSSPGTVFNWELRKVRKDGTMLWVKETARAVRGPGGQPMVLIVCEDITERRRAEDELERERRLFMGGPVVVFRWIAWTGGRVEYVSRNVSMVFGYQADDFLSGLVRYDELIHPDDLERVLQELRDYESRGVQRFQQHYRIVRRDGEVRWLDDYTVIFRDERGRVTHHEGYVLDVTHRRQMEEARRQAEAKYRTIFENAVEGIYQTTPDGRVLTVNPAMARMLGFASPDQLIAETTDLARQHYVDPERRAEFRGLLEERGEVHGFEAQVRRRDGALIWLSMTARAVRDERGVVVYYEGTAEEITERRRAEEMLRRSETMSAMGLLVAGVAHEVRNPLFGISASLDAFEAKAGPRSSFQKIVATLRREVGRLVTLMEELLDYGRPMDPVRSPGRIDQVVAEAAASCANLAASRGVEVRSRVGDGLPLIEMDRRRLVQVVQNLIQNGIEHAGSGGAVDVQAAVESDGGEPWVVLTVRDTGPGFRPEDLPRLFEPFFSRRRGGTGLGLAIVHRIVVEHGGTVTAANRPEGGGRMEVRLPASKAAHP
jgi:PAS domain S-box-containing protein